MKQEASKKSKKWLWIVLAVVAVLAVAGVVLALVFGGSGDTDKAAGGRPDLYWNVGRQSHLDPNTGLSNREAAADGLFYVTFAHNGEQVEYAVVDKKTVNYIDAMDVMGLVFDNDGIVVDAIAPTDIGTVISTSLYVQRADKNTIVANSTITMNGMIYNFKITDQTEVFDVTGNGEFEGVKIDPASVGAMATIAVYGDMEKQATHIYVKSYPVESKVYWRADQFYNSTTKETTRELGEDGAYAIPFFCDGEIVTLKCKDKDLVTSIDKVSWGYPHFGFRFDEDGYIVETLNSGLGSRTIVACQQYDITEVNGEFFTASNIRKNDGQSLEGVITENTAIYDVSTAAKAEGVAGKRIDSLQVGDTVTVWKDADGNIVLIYVPIRLVDSPCYYRPSRKYSSTTKETTLQPNENGVYEIELLRAGDKETTIYKTTDKAIATAVHVDKSNVVGLKLDGNNNIQYVYDSYALFGGGAFVRGRYVTDVTGVLANYASGSSIRSGMTAADAKIYNVSALGDYGAETTLQVGDYVYAYKIPSGELGLIYVIRRYTGEDSLYFNLERMYDTDAKQSTRQPDADGWYWFDMMVQTKKVRLKTKDIKLVNSIDAVEIRISALVVKGDVITDVLAAQYGTGGAKGLSGYNITAINDDGTVEARHNSNGKEGSFKMAEDCEIYNVSQNFDKYIGERTTLQLGDMITAYHNMVGEAKVIFVRQRETKDMYWKYDRYYDSTNEVTLREPDADGWYWYKMTVNGKTVTLKTQDKKVATAVDYHSGGFGLNLDGDVIRGCVSYGFVKNVYGLGYSGYTVTKVNGSKVTLTYTYPSASTTGAVKEIVLDKNVKIFDVSDPSSAEFGKAASLQVGDVVRTYNSEDKETQMYVYIQAHATRKGGYMSYCDHCDQVVYWNPYIGSFAAYDGHYYLANDRVNTASQNLGTTSRDFETVLDLNGHTLERVGGRVLRVRYNDTLNIIDSVGGGKISGSAPGWLGGTLYISDGGIVNMYGGTLTQTDDEEIKPARGGVVYMTSSTSVFNMYGGALENGRSYARGDDYAAGGNLYASGGTFNMYDGKISGGKSFNGSYEKDNGDGTTTTTSLYGYGGNVFLSGSTVANITGGTIEGGYADRYGGNIAIMNSKVKLNVKNATITGGETLRYGGNLYGYGTIVLDDAIISNGYAGIIGGNIYSNGSTITLNSGAKVVDGTAKTYGGNIYAIYSGTLNINKGSVISGGESGSYGGNLFVAANDVGSTSTRAFTVNMTGGTITDGESTAQSGGNIYQAGGTVNISGGEITDGKAKKYGANIYGINEGILNISGDALISNGQSVSDGGNIYVAGNQKVDDNAEVATRKFTLNISGGTITKGVSATQSGGNIYQAGGFLNISGGEITDGLCETSGEIGGNIYVVADEFNLSGGVISGGKVVDADYDIFVNAKTQIMNISGGEVAGRFRVNSTNNTISGAPKLGLLDMYKNCMLEVGEMAEGASVMVKSGTSGMIFTNPFENAVAYAEAGYFKNYDDGSLAQANGDSRLYLVEYIAPAPDYNEVYDKAVAMTQQGVFDQGGTVTAECPYCGETVQWTALEANETTSSLSLAAGHYYLADDIENTERFTTDKAVCIHLNGHSMTSAVRNFYIDHTGILTIMGDGEVIGGLKKSDPQYGANLDSSGIINLCGGIIKTTSTSAAIGARGRSLDSTALNIYEGTVLQGDGTAPLVAVYGKTTMNVHGGTITGGTTNIIIVPENEASRVLTLNVYGGTISNGTAVKGGNIYAKGSAASVYVNITGGTITGGSVFAENLVTEVNISGNPVIEHLDLSDGIVIGLGEMTEGAAVAVSGTGVFTDVLTNANDYLAYISAYETGKEVTVTATGALTLGGEDPENPDAPVIPDTPVTPEIPNTKEVCPHCGKTWAELEANNEIIELEGIADATKDNRYVLKADNGYTGGHYRLMGDVITTTASTNPLAIDYTGEEFVIDLNGFSITSNGPSGKAIALGGSANNMQIWILDSDRDNDPATVGSLNNAATSGTGNAIYTGGKNNTVNIYDIIINDTTSDSYTKACAGVYLTENATVNMYSGVINGKSTASKVVGVVDLAASGAAFNMYGGTINAAPGMNAISNEDGEINQTINLVGGTVNGAVVLNNPTGEGNVLQVAGAPVIRSLDLTNGALVTVGALTDGAEISVVVVDGAPFTDVLQNAADYAGYFKAEGHHMGATVNADGKLEIAQICPHCRVPLADITWIELAGIDNATSDNRYVIKEGNTYSEGGHYRLVGDLVGTNSTPLVVDINDAEVVFDMNGHSIITTTSRAFGIGSTRTGTKVWFLDTDLDADPTTIGTLSCAVKKSDGAAFYTGKSGNTVDIYDIVINGTTDSTFQSKGSSVYVTANSTVNMYSGVINGFVGTTDKNYGVIALGNGAAFNMYGGTVNGVDGIYAISNIKDATKVTINLEGGTVNGVVALATNTDNTIQVSGAPVITELDLTNGAIVELGALKEGASIAVNAADNAPFTAAMENAADYLAYIGAKAAGKTVSVNADNCLIIVDDASV